MRSTPGVFNPEDRKSVRAVLGATKGSGAPACVYYKDKEKGGNHRRESTPRIGKYSSKSIILIGLLDTSSAVVFLAVSRIIGVAESLPELVRQVPDAKPAGPERIGTLLLPAHFTFSTRRRFASILT
jgi:hypothetical protein